VLQRKRVEEGKEVYQLILPQTERAKAMKGLHDDIGHMGKN
jgi:hypothetical protein